jgi:hypothetical protein
VEAGGTITASGGTIHVVEWDELTGQTLEGDCAVTVEVVQGGAIYARFECRAFTDGPYAECVPSGAFVFENCRR